MRTNIEFKSPFNVANACCELLKAAPVDGSNGHSICSFSAQFCSLAHI